MGMEVDSFKLPALRSNVRVIVQGGGELQIFELDEVKVEVKFPQVKEFYTQDECKTPADLNRAVFDLKIEGHSGKR